MIERLVRPNELQGPSNFDLSVVLPIRERYKPAENYLLRVDPERRAEVLAAATAALERSRRGRVILEKQTVEELRNEFYRGDRAMAWLLLGVHGAAHHCQSARSASGHSGSSPCSARRDAPPPFLRQWPRGRCSDAQALLRQSGRVVAAGVLPSQARISGSSRPRARMHWSISSSICLTATFPPGSRANVSLT